MIQWIHSTDYAAFLQVKSLPMTQEPLVPEEVSRGEGNTAISRMDLWDPTQNSKLTGKIQI